MKLGWRKNVALLGLLLVAAALGGPSRAQAASGLKKNIAVIYDGNAGETITEKIADIDWDGDGAADTLSIAVKRTKKDDNGAIEKITLKLNNKKAWSKTISQPSDYSVSFDYLKLSSVGTMLHLRTVGDNDWSAMEKILYLDPQTKKFTEALDLLGLAQGTKLKKVTAKTVTVTCWQQPDLVGHLQYNLQFKWKAGKDGAPGKLALVSRKVKATSRLADIGPADKYTKLAKKNQFKVKKKKLTFYKSATSNKKAFTVKKGKKVTLKKIYIMKSWQCALQFKYGSKTGWLKNTLEDWMGGEPQYNTFYGVVNHLAG